MRDTPELEAVRKAVVARGKVAGGDGLASEIGRGAAVGPVKAIGEVEEDD